MISVPNEVQAAFNRWVEGRPTQDDINRYCNTEATRFDVLMNRRRYHSLFGGIELVTSESVPQGTLEFHSGGRCVGMIVNIGGSDV